MNSARLFAVVAAGSLTFSALSGCAPTPSAPRTVVPIYEAPQGWSGFGPVTVDSRLATDAVDSKVLRLGHGQSTFSESLNTGIEDMAVQEVASISTVAASFPSAFRRKAKESPVGKVVMYASVSVDGFIADENDQPGTAVRLVAPAVTSRWTRAARSAKVSQIVVRYTRPYWGPDRGDDRGRHVFDMTDGWDGKPPSGIDHVVVVTHRPAPEGWDPETPFHFVDGVEAAMAKAQELAGNRIVEVAAGDVGGQVLAAGLIDEVRMDVVPVVFGSGKRYFGSVHAQHPLEDPDVVIQANRVLHLRYRVRR